MRRNSVIPGKENKSITLKISLNKNGKTPLKVSVMLTSPAILLIIKTFFPLTIGAAIELTSFFQIVSPSFTLSEKILEPDDEGVSLVDLISGREKLLFTMN